MKQEGVRWHTSLTTFEDSKVWKRIFREAKSCRIFEIQIFVFVVIVALSSSAVSLLIECSIVGKFMCLFGLYVHVS